MLISGRDIYGEGRTCKFSAGGVSKVSSSQLLCHERATIKGVHLQNKIIRVNKTVWNPSKIQSAWDNKNLCLLHASTTKCHT